MFKGDGMTRVLMIVLLALILQGCMPAAFVAGAATGTIIYDQRDTKTIFEDRNITFKIQNKFNSDSELRKNSHVTITTFNHIALLLGQVSDERLRDRAEEIVKSNSKVKLVYNEITVGKPISSMTQTNDSWITTKVKTVLVTVPGLNSSTLKVVTEDGTVYLMGLTTREQGKLAADKTRRVSGVKKVVKLFEYVS